MAKWLVTGASGQVGGALIAPWASGDDEWWGPSRAELDLADLPEDDLLDAMLVERNIDAIINCAAYTAVDNAEGEPDLAFTINGIAPGRLARAAVRAKRGAGIPFIQVSTDYVFSGDMCDRPYREDDPVDPQSCYGRSKLAGEHAVAASGARYAIVRTAWVISPRGANFVRTMLRLGRERDEVKVVSDQFGCPTDADELAAQLIYIGKRFLDDPRQPSGIWHRTNSGETSWHGVAARVFASAAELDRPSPRLRAITTAEYPTAAKRPANSRLDNAKILRDFGLRSAPWESAVDLIVSKIIIAGEDQRA
jgi:dTDP-4-dehydrorhamnose reductase